MAISGANTGLVNPDGIAIEGNELFVANDGSGSVTVFLTSASGNVAPLRTLSGAATLLGFPFGVATGIAP